MSGPLDIDAIEARAQYVHATATGKPYALAEDARLLCAEVRQLRQALAAVEKLAGRRGGPPPKPAKPCSPPS